MEQRISVWVGALLKDNKKRLLFVQRSVGSSLPLLWQLPGGTLEWSEKITDALKREINEETSGRAINPKLFEVNTIIGRIKERQIHIVQIIYIARFDGIVRLSDEHDDFRWMSLDEAKDEKLIGDLKRFIYDKKNYSRIVQFLNEKGD